MAHQEGRCPNCGSIVYVGSKNEQSHCLFCDAVFDSEQAIAIAQNPDGHTFPNEPQPKYEGPSLQPNQRGQASRKKAQPAAQKAKPKPPPPPTFEFTEPENLPDVRLPKGIKLRIALIALALIVLAAGISVPVVMRRNSVRQQMLDALPQLAPFALDIDRDVSVWHNKNDYYMVATGESIAEDEVVAFFKALCEKRADVLSIDSGSFQDIYSPVKLKLVSPEGGFLIDRPAQAADLDTHQAIVHLP